MLVDFSDVAPRRRKRNADELQLSAEDYEENYSDEEIFAAGSAIETKIDLFAGLKEKLGISAGNEAYRSSTSDNEGEIIFNQKIWQTKFVLPSGKEAEQLGYFFPADNQVFTVRTHRPVLPQLPGGVEEEEETH